MLKYGVAVCGLLGATYLGYGVGSLMMALGDPLGLSVPSGNHDYHNNPNGNHNYNNDFIGDYNYDNNNNYHGDGSAIANPDYLDTRRDPVSPVTTQAPPPRSTSMSPDQETGIPMMLTALEAVGVGSFSVIAALLFLLNVKDYKTIQIGSFICFLMSICFLLVLIVSAALTQEGGLVSLSTSYLIYLFGLVRHFLNTRLKGAFSLHVGLSCEWWRVAPDASSSTDPSTPAVNGQGQESLTGTEVV